VSAVPAVVLLDTHAFLWFALGDAQMSDRARVAVEEAPVAYVSAASVWEIRTQYRLGKLAGASGIVSGLPAHIRRLGLTPLAVEVEDGDLAGALAGAHRDPFDRMLAAQAIQRGIAIVSNDTALDGFGATRCW
jgi:PIN domain nuclease of toxin-antitoxin system